jgi:hypothetical protein
MPANLPAEAKAKWLEVTLTKNPETKLQLMEEFLGLVPKHKGTEKLRAQVKRQMAGLRDDIEKKKRQAKLGSAPSYFVQKAGAAQVSVLGPPNVGRSSLLKAVTNAQVEVTNYPFGTITPIPGMLPYEDIQFQLVEVPPIIEGSSEGRAEGYQNLSMARNSDALMIMVDLKDRPLENLNMVLRELNNSRILPIEPPGEVEIERRGYGRDIQFMWEGELFGCTKEEVIELLREFKIRSALVRIRGKVTLDIVEDYLFGSSVFRPTLILANKLDLIEDTEIVKRLERVAAPLEVLPISTEKTSGLGDLIGGKLFQLLNISRIYTKEKGRVANEPIVSHGEISVGDLAKRIHNDFYDNFKYAKIWGPSANFPKERVGMDRVLKDGTTIQIYV